MRWIGLLFTLLFCLNCSAWNQAVLDGISTLDEKLTRNSPFFNGFEFSLWSSIRARIYDPKKKKIKIQSKFLANKVRVAYQLKKPAIAELYVYIPGIFNNVNEGQTKRAFERMTQLSSNVLVLPNPWGTDYIKAEPKHKPGDILREAESLHDLTSNFIFTMGMPKNTKVFLYGASYGGFLASVFANVDRELEFNMVDREVYVFSPPLNMKRSIQNIDELMFEDDFFGREIPDKNLALVFLDYVFARRAKDLDVSTRVLTKDIIIKEGFKEPFRKALKIFHKNDPRFDHNKKDYYFSSYINDLAPELKLLMNSTAAELDYWVSGGARKHDLDIKVIVSTNDFLNGITFPALYPRANFWFFPSGGHLGYIAMPEFENFLYSTRTELRSHIR